MRTGTSARRTFKTQSVTESHRLPWVTADGRPTPTAKMMMESLRTGAMTPDKLAEVTHLPIFRIRSSLRELVQARWVQETEGRYKVTQSGRFERVRRTEPLGWFLPCQLPRVFVELYPLCLSVPFLTRIPYISRSASLSQPQIETVAFEAPMVSLWSAQAHAVPRNDIGDDASGHTPASGWRHIRSSPG